MNNDILSIISEYSLSPHMFHSRVHMCHVCPWLPRDIAEIAWNHPGLLLIFTSERHWILRWNIRTKRVDPGKRLRKMIRRLWGYFGHASFRTNGNCIQELKHCPAHIALRYDFYTLSDVYEYGDIETLAWVLKSRPDNIYTTKHTIREAFRSGRPDVINCALSFMMTRNNRLDLISLIQLAVESGNVKAVEYVYPRGKITEEMLPDISRPSIEYSIKFIRYLSFRVSSFTTSFIKYAASHSLQMLHVIERRNGHLDMDEEIISYICNVGGLREVKYAFQRWPHLFHYSLIDNTGAAEVHSWLLCQLSGGTRDVVGELNRAIAAGDRAAMYDIKNSGHPIYELYINFDTNPDEIPFVHSLFNFTYVPTIIFRRDIAEVFRRYIELCPNNTVNMFGSICHNIMSNDSIKCLAVLLEMYPERVMRKSVVSLAIRYESYLCLQHLLSAGCPVNIPDCLMRVRDNDILKLLGIRAHVFNIVSYNGMYDDEDVDYG